MEACGIFADEDAGRAWFALVVRWLPPLAARAFVPARSLVAVTADEVVVVRVRSRRGWEPAGPVRRWARAEVGPGERTLSITLPGRGELQGDHPYDAAAAVVRCLASPGD